MDVVIYYTNLRLWHCFSRQAFAPLCSSEQQPDEKDTVHQASENIGKTQTELGTKILRFGWVSQFCANRKGWVMCFFNPPHFQMLWLLPYIVF